MLIAVVEGTDGPIICNIALNKLGQYRPAVTGKYPPPPTRQCCSLIKHANLTCLSRLNLTVHLHCLRNVNRTGRCHHNAKHESVQVAGTAEMLFRLKLLLNFTSCCNYFNFLLIFH
ncbi:hypothetical protein V6N13_085010 [Hibiscus sabdariffa]|uniref:Uncharacterized protein n=1 Tax=Hibiscus sabdariffa TaxID=183260 RepID=A0ABR2D2Z6_9ROSI